MRYGPHVHTRVPCMTHTVCVILHTLLPCHPGPALCRSTPHTARSQRKRGPAAQLREDRTTSRLPLPNGRPFTHSLRPWRATPPTRTQPDLNPRRRVERASSLPAYLQQHHGRCSTASAAMPAYNPVGTRGGLAATLLRNAAPIPPHTHSCQPPHRISGTMSTGTQQTHRAALHRGVPPVTRAQPCR